MTSRPQQLVQFGTESGVAFDDARRRTGSSRTSNGSATSTATSVPPSRRSTAASTCAALRVFAAQLNLCGRGLRPAPRDHPSTSPRRGLRSRTAAAEWRHRGRQLRPPLVAEIAGGVAAAVRRHRSTDSMSTAGRAIPVKSRFRQRRSLQSPLWRIRGAEWFARLAITSSSLTPRSAGGVAQLGSAPVRRVGGRTPRTTGSATVAVCRSATYRTPPTKAAASSTASDAI
jgi:hypothetical protein